MRIHICNGTNLRDLVRTRTELRELELCFAYECASGVIESSCVMAAEVGCMKFYNLRSAEVDVTDEVRYLQSRRLLDLHPDNPHWVSVRDEGEPLPEGHGGY